MNDQADADNTDAESTEPPQATFEALPLSKEVAQALQDMGFEHPTPVQLAAYEPAVEGKDIIVQAQTGSGKTGAFGIPLVEAVDTTLAETQAIVLLPTRELANQVLE